MDQVRSEIVDVCGVGVRVLRADAAPGAPPDAPTQLLVHPAPAGAHWWLRPLTAHGPVVAPDVPRSRTTRVETDARFLRAFTAALGAGRVVVHGWSIGALAALLFADLAPARVDRLILVNPALPGPLTAGQVAAWQTVGRLGLAAGPALARGILVLSGRRRLLGSVPAVASALSALYVDRGPVQRAIAGVKTPTLVLWGGRDPVVDRGAVDGLAARRPDWDVHEFSSAGHLLPLQLPDCYAEVAGAWLAADPEPDEEE